MKTMKMMVVGVGALGRHHARIISDLEGVTLAAVADLREEIGREIAAQFDTKWIADFRELIDDVDAASIVVPTSLHLPVATEFLRRGIPVLVEKPLVADPADGRQLLQLAEQTESTLQVGHVERFNPAMTAARRVCGLPRYIRTERLSPFPFRSLDIGVVHDLLIHDIDLVLDLVRSPVASVDAIGTSVISQHEDVVNARLKFENGAVADLTASRVNPAAKREMQIWSAIGCVTVDFQERQVVSYTPGEELLFGKSPIEQAREPGADIDQLKADVFGRFIRVEESDVADGDALTAEIEEFVTCVRTGQRPSCGGKEAVAALEIAEQVLESMSRQAHPSNEQRRVA